MAGYFNAHYMANLVEYSYFHLSWFLSDLNRPYRLDLERLLHQYLLNQDNDLRRREESKGVLLQALRSDDPSLSEAAAKLLQKEIDQETARELLLHGERLHDHVQGPLLKKAVALLPESEAEAWYKKVIQHRRAIPLMGDAICALYPKDPHLCEAALEGLLQSGKEEAIVLALQTLRSLPLPSYKTVVREYAASDCIAFRRAAWEAMEGFHFTPEERAALLPLGLEEGDEAVRACALKLLPAEELSDPKRFLLDSSAKVREIVLRKILRLRRTPLELLADLDFFHRDYRAMMELRSVEEAPLDPQGAQALLLWGADYCKCLQALKQSVVGGKRVQKTILAILNQEIAAWRGVLLGEWLCLEGKKEWEKLLPFVDHPEAVLREYARVIFRLQVPAPLEAILSKRDTSISLDEASLIDSIYSSAHSLLRALILFGLRASLWARSDRSREKILQRAQADRSSLVREEVCFLNDFKEEAMTEQAPPPTITSVEKILLLKSVDLFREVPVEKLLLLADSLFLQTCAAGEAIVTQGEVGDALFVIVSGRARVEKRREEGRTAPIAELGEGEAFGEMSILDRETRSATVRALEATRLLSLQGDDFRRLAKEDPEIALALAATLSRRLRASQGTSM